MRKVELNIADLAVGTVIELTGKDLANVRFVRSKLSEKVRKDGEDPLTYHHFSVAGRGFTIDSNDEESANMLKDAEKRKTIAVLTLEATEHQVEDTNDDGDPLGTFSARKSFRFISVLNMADYKAYAQNAGEVTAIENKLVPKDASLTAKQQQDAINSAVQSGFQNLLALMNKPATPVAAPQAAPAVHAEA